MGQAERQIILDLIGDFETLVVKLERAIETTSFDGTDLAALHRARHAAQRGAATAQRALSAN